MWRKRNPPAMLMEMEIDTAAMENNMEISYRLRKKLPYDPAIPFLSIYLQKTTIQKDTCTSVFITALFYNSQDMEAI